MGVRSPQPIAIDENDVAQNATDINPHTAMALRKMWLKPSHLLVRPMGPDRRVKKHVEDSPSSLVGHCTQPFAWGGLLRCVERAWDRWRCCIAAPPAALALRNMQQTIDDPKPQSRRYWLASWKSWRHVRSGRPRGRTADGQYPCGHASCRCRASGIRCWR